jgi:spermidine synthase
VQLSWRRDAELFLLGALILYLELVLIRWIGTEIRVFAYLGNLVLVICFFGAGLGCYLAAARVSLWRVGFNLLILVALISNPFRLSWLDLRVVTYLLSGFEDSPVWTWTEGLTVLHVVAGLVILGVLLYLVAMTFVPLGQILGRALQEHPRIIWAYSLNIAGSLAGVWLFDGSSWVGWPPVVWYGTAGALLALLAGCSVRAKAGLAVAFVGLAAVATWFGRDENVRLIWSPYHKLAVQPFSVQVGRERVQQGYLMSVNDTFYQNLLDLSVEFLRLHPGAFDRRNAYDLSFAYKPHVRRLLIVGAGAGNNAAAALRHGVEQIDCVEIDPAIYAIGKELHPERPYDSPRVRMVVNDARAFFKQATGPYDMIWFGWLDSHTLGSSYNNLRLDHYVYTLESFREAKRLLAEDAVLVVNFSHEREWIADRLYGMMRQLFGHEPLAIYQAHILPELGFGGGITLVSGRTPIALDAVENASDREYIAAHLIRLPGTTRSTTDDWPYVYLQSPKIPKLHLLTLLTILGTVAVARKRIFGIQGGIDWHFFTLGAAFMLLEVQTVSRATLLFGMTWVVNAIVISAVLIMILLANVVGARWPRLPAPAVVGGLAVTIGALGAVPLDWFNALPAATKLIVASAFLTAPVFFAGLIFIRSFGVCTDRPAALGSNLIGALVGGLLESVSFVTGVRALIVMVGLFYLIAVLTRPGDRAGRVAPTVPLTVSG